MKLTRYALTALIAGGGLCLSGMALATISGSKHDLSSGGTSQLQGSLSTTQVCVFCHTPHGSNTGVTAPLWNKDTPATTYTRYSSLGTATLDGTESTVGSVSLACLSCHDGTQAMDAVLNAPGTGMNPGRLTDHADGLMTGTSVPNLGADLSNDHPISIAYAGGACEGITTATCTPADRPNAGKGDIDFKIAQYASINTQDQWWVDTAPGTGGTKDKTDMILYTRDYAGTNGPSVECASCHDPHEAASTPVSFLRINNESSAVCLACHTK